MRSINGVDRIVDCCVHDGEASGGVDGRRLGTGCANDHQKISIPLDDWVHWLRGGANGLMR
jgi:hypothetical protein